MDVQRFLILLGLVILITGVMWPLLSRIGLGRLPGDIVFQRGGATFYFPLVIIRNPHSGHLHHRQPNTQCRVLADQPMITTPYATRRSSYLP
jgi:hypothetical protein